MPGLTLPLLSTGKRKFKFGALFLLWLTTFLLFPYFSSMILKTLNLTQKQISLTLSFPNPKMKFTPSPSVSSSTSKGSVFGHLSFILRRFLCSKIPPTHPFDQFNELDSFEDQTPNSIKSDAPSTPNLVARLMGLDLMPDTDTRKISPPITRSKSTNSMDCRFQKTEEMHMRLKSSVSFRETTSYFELEDDDFFVLRFEDGKKKRKNRSRKAKSEAGGERNRERRWRRTERIRMPEEQGRRHRFKIEEGDDLKVFVNQLGNLDDEVKAARIRKKKKEECLVDVRFETESESENLSPVSVLDHSCLFIGDHEVPTSAEEETTNGSSSPIRKLISDLSNLEHPTYDHSNEACPTSNNDQEPYETLESTQAGLRRKDYHRHQNTEMLNQICRLAESEMVDSEWDFKGGSTRNFKKWEVGIGVELGLHIVDQLLDEVVHQLFVGALIKKF